MTFAPNPRLTPRALARRSLEGLALGNGAAMRVAPLGAWFRRDLRLVIAQATLSAEVIHAHPEGTAPAIPFAVRCAARHPDDPTSALWSTAEGFGDVDTACAITGGIVGARTGVGHVPEEWLSRREAVPGAG